MTKKITYADVAYISRYSRVNYIERLVCHHSLTDGTEGGHCFRLISKVRWVWFCLLYLPITICQLVYCLWDGGLKEFELMGGADRIVNNRLEYYNSTEDSCYDRMKKVWERA